MESGQNTQRLKTIGRKPVGQFVKYTSFFSNFAITLYTIKCTFSYMDAGSGDERFSTEIYGRWRNYTQGSAQVAKVLNVSTGGFLAEICQPVHVGDAIEFSADNFVLTGEVIHCRPDGNKWLAGVRVQHRLTSEQLTKILHLFG
jgi:hypothetical protein